MPPDATTQQRPSAALGLITILMTLAGWSSVPLFIKHFSAAIDPWTSNGWRYGFSALLWMPVLIVGALGIGGRSLPRGLWRAALLPAVFNAIGQAAFTWAFYKLDPATVTFGLRMQIVFVATGAYLLFPSERAALRKPAAWGGIVLVLVGIGGTVLMSAPSGAAAHSGEAHLLGIVLAIGSGIFFAAYALAVRWFMHGYHPVTAFAAISQYTALVTVALMLAAGDRHGLTALDTTVLSRGQFGLLLVSAIIGIALGHVFYYISIARLGVAVSSGVIQLQPFCVAIAQAALGWQSINRGQIAFGTGAVCGSMLLLWVQWRTSREAGRIAAAPSHLPIDPAKLPEVVPGPEAVGIEAAEMDVVPVRTESRSQ